MNCFQPTIAAGSFGVPPTLLSPADHALWSRLHRAARGAHSRLGSRTVPPNVQSMRAGIMLRTERPGIFHAAFISEQRFGRYTYVALIQPANR